MQKFSSLKDKVIKEALDFWYRPTLTAYLLLPFAWIFQLVCWLRLQYYRYRKQISFEVPIIVIGNITLGGTGKTPMVAWLATFLQQQGFRPGILTRGFKGALHANQQIIVTDQSDVTIVGDEPLWLAKKCQCPVVVGRNRVKAAGLLLKEKPDINIILSDDGLQHYALPRSIEIALIDGTRRLGNEFCLPAGPLREPGRRLKQVDFIICNGSPQAGEWQMTASLDSKAYNVKEPHHYLNLEELKGKTVHAVAAIGNPLRFFNMLRAKGIEVIEHAFEDHIFFTPEDLHFDDSLPIVMTEKDAIKCQAIAPSNAWVIPLLVNLPSEFNESLLRKIHYG